MCAQEIRSQTAHGKRQREDKDKCQQAPGLWARKFFEETRQDLLTTNAERNLGRAYSRDTPKAFNSSAQGNTLGKTVQTASLYPEGVIQETYRASIPDIPLVEFYIITS